MKVGNISLNPEAFKDWTKEQFFEAYKGKLAIDKEQVWQMIIDANKKETYILPKELGEALGLKEVKHESISKSSEPGEKSKRRRFDADSKSGS